MKFLHLIPSVDPVSGGPIEYARIVADEHAKLGHECVFVCLDALDNQSLRDFPFEVYATGPVTGLMKSTPKYAQTIRRIAPDCDAAVVHGLWNHAAIGGHAALTESGTPWVVFTHGMLDPYFRRAKPVKHWIKQIYWLLWQGRMLSDAAAVLFTCEEERRLAQGAFAGHNQWRERVVSFCASDQAIPASERDVKENVFLALLPALEGRDYLLFLSRIHPKKACDQLIEAFAKIAELDPQLDLVIAGPDQIGWKAELVALAERLEIAARVHWPGMVTGSSKAAAFAGARAFTLPSHQENFGLVVAEALSTGTPVLISTQVNIWREVVEAGAGLAEPDTVDGTEQLLRRFIEMSPEARLTMRERARQCYDARFSAQAAAGDLLAVLQAASTTAPRP